MVGRSIEGFVAGVGTGGTLGGIGAALRQMGHRAQLGRAMPEIGVCSQGQPETCGGIPRVVDGMNEILDESMIDHEIAVPDAEAIGAARELVRMGFAVGPSRGLDFAAAPRLARSRPRRGHRVVRPHGALFLHRPLRRRSGAPMIVPGLPALAGGWRAFAGLDADDQLARLGPWVERLRAVDVAALAAHARLPPGEVAASPFGLRAVALAVRAGATSVDRETRTLIDWTGTPITEDPNHGVWEAGRLHVGKYQAFLQDAPFATYDPAHIAKWGPHELMHRAAGFFWRRDMGRFELYLGARLNELLPVALWYGPDQWLRLRDGADGFVRAAAPREAPLEAAVWLDGDFGAMGSTLCWLRSGFEHVAGELAVIDREGASGRTLASPVHRGGAVLDASSDAAAYVLGHYERLTEPAVADVLEAVSRGDRFDAIEAYRAHVERVWSDLFFGDILIEETAVKAARGARVRWDQALRRALGADDGATGADGHQGMDMGQLHDGVLSVAPVTADLAEDLDPEWLDRFSESDAIRVRAPLGERLRRFWAASHPLLADLVHFENLLATCAPGTRNHLADPDGDRVARSDGFALHRFGHDVLALHAGGESRDPSPVLIGRVDEEVAVIPLDGRSEALWVTLSEASLEADEARDLAGDDWVDALLTAGALVPL